MTLRLFENERLDRVRLVLVTSLDETLLLLKAVLLLLKEPLLLLPIRLALVVLAFGEEEMEVLAKELGLNK